MKKFLIVNPFGIGDCLFTTPVIRAIKDDIPDAFIGYWCNQRVKGLFQHNPSVDKIFALSRGDLKKIYQESWLEGTGRSLGLFFELKKEKFDCALDFSLDQRYCLIEKFAGIKRRIGFNYKGRGRLLTDKIQLAGYSDKHMVEYYLDLLKPLALEPKSNRLEVFVTENSRAKGRVVFKVNGIKEEDLVVGIAPGAGASWGKDALLKHWPPLNFAQLAQRLIQELGARVLILGDNIERPIVDIIVYSMKNKPIDLAGQTSLEELIAIMDKINLLVTNDGGLLHIATALGKKTVSFFGPVDPKVYGPYPADEKRHIVLRKALDCSPCYQNFQLAPCAKDRECLAAISVEEAYAAVKLLLS